MLVLFSISNNRICKIRPSVLPFRILRSCPNLFPFTGNDLSLCNVNIRKDWWHVACVFRLRIAGCDQGACWRASGRTIESETSHLNLCSCCCCVGARLLGRLGCVGDQAAHRVSAQDSYRAKYSLHRLPSARGKRSRGWPTGYGSLFGLSCEQRLEKPGDRETQGLWREGTRNSLAAGVALAGACVFFSSRPRHCSQARLPVLPWTHGNARSSTAATAQNADDGRLHRLSYEIEINRHSSDQSNGPRSCLLPAVGQRL